MNDLRARLRLPLKIIEVGDLRWIEDATGGAVPLDSVIDAINGDTSLYVGKPSWKQQDADMMAAAIDAAIHRNALDPRSEIADCRLDYGRPFSAEEIEQHLSRRRHGKNASTISGKRST